MSINSSNSNCSCITINVSVLLLNTFYFIIIWSLLLANSISLYSEPWTVESSVSPSEFLSFAIFRILWILFTVNKVKHMTLHWSQVSRYLVFSTYWLDSCLSLLSLEQWNRLCHFSSFQVLYYFGSCEYCLLWIR